LLIDSQARLSYPAKLGLNAYNLLIFFQFSKKVLTNGNLTFIMNHCAFSMTAVLARQQTVVARAYPSPTAGPAALGSAIDARPDIFQSA
jgi:hypothetical protein